MPPQWPRPSASVSILGIEPHLAPTIPTPAGPPPATNDDARVPIEARSPMLLSPLEPAALARCERPRRQALIVPAITGSASQLSHRAASTGSENQPRRTLLQLPRRPTIPPRLSTVSPTSLMTLLLSRETPEARLCIPNVPLEMLIAWEDLHGRLRIPERNRPLRLQYNGLTGSVIVQLGASPLHDAVGRFFVRATSDGLQTILPPCPSAGDGSYAAYASGLPSASSAYDDLGIQLCLGSESTGFTGIDGLAQGSRKAPDFALRMGWGARFGALVVEVGFAESWRGLMHDAMLHLRGTEGETRVAVLIKISEGARTGLEAWREWPEDAVPLPADETPGEVRRAEARLAEWYLRQSVADPRTLVGDISATLALYVPAEDAGRMATALAAEHPEHSASPDSGIPAHPAASDPAFADIACVYSREFLRDGTPSQEPSAGDGLLLRVPYGLLFAQPQGAQQSHDPPSPVPEELRPHLDKCIVFNLHALAIAMQRMAPQMRRWRATSRAHATMAALSSAMGAARKRKTGMVQGEPAAGVGGGGDDNEADAPAQLVEVAEGRPKRQRYENKRYDPVDLPTTTELAEARGRMWTRFKTENMAASDDQTEEDGEEDGEQEGTEGGGGQGHQVDVVAVEGSSCHSSDGEWLPSGSSSSHTE